MTPLEVEQTVTALVVKQVPVFLWGAPGIGKSSIVKNIAKGLDLECLDLRLTLLDPTDLKGVPFLHEKQAVWATPSFLPKSGTKGGILFLDELNAAAPSVQAAAYQLILDRKVGEYELPDNWAIVAAGNRQTDRAVTHKIPTALANRFVHFDMEVDVKQWMVWAYETKIDPYIIAFISQRNDALFSFDPLKKEKSFATPRSWSFVSDILQANVAVNQLFETIGGAIGKELAAAFIAFKNSIDELPDSMTILEGKSKFYPKDTNGLHLLSSLLIHKCLETKDKKALNNLLEYTLNLEPEFAILIIRSLEAQGVRFNRLEAWKDWVQTFSDLI